MSADPAALVLDYDPAWPNVFEEVRSRIQQAISDLDARIEHVGSTAVPGLAAKPIIDIDIVVPTIANVPSMVERLATIGYVHQGDLGVTGREAFRSRHEEPRHYLYVVVAGSQPHRNHVDLRDYLRQHPKEAQRYAARKRKIAHLLTVDREAYVAGKSELVEELLRRARRRGSPGA